MKTIVQVATSTIIISSNLFLGQLCVDLGRGLLNSYLKQNLLCLLKNGFSKFQFVLFNCLGIALRSDVS